MYRQGDLIIKKIDILPDNLKKASNNVLAYGEVTGHKHQLKSKQVLVYEKDNAKYLKLTKPTELIHEEHKSINLDVGNYVILHEREFDPIKSELRQVLD